jgi:transglutaminase-like putative cysteine protease
MASGGMSTSPQVALLPPLGRHEAAPRLRGEARRERPLVRLATFGALAAFAVERWATLDRGAPTWRLIGLIALALALAACGPILRRRSVVLASALAVVAVVALFPISGIPLSWVTHVRVAVTISAIGDGLSALPNVAVPYTGVDEWVRLVIVLGAAVLLIDAAAMLAFAPGEPSGARRAAAAFPLIVLAAIPSTIIAPQFPYLQGLILFVLLAAFLWGERIERTRVAGAVGLCAVAGIAALVIAPALETHKPWLDYRALWGKLAVKSESFDWSQGYGPLNWPRTGRTVLQVRAARPDYWKAEDLDLFGGKGWVLGDVPGAQDPSGSISRAARARWTQTIQVTVSDMVTSQVIAAGSAGPPTHLVKPFVAGPSPGTWSTNGELVPGDSYSITTYSPRPSDAQLARAGTAYPAELLPGFLTIYIPGPAPVVGQLQQVVFAPFGSTRAAAYGPASAGPGPVLRASPYAPAYALALRLRRAAATPLAYVHAVEGYLARGFSYNENPAPAAYPLESFLFRNHAGYCQQFAGAMALLLRMGGIPARVSVGFTPGNYDTATHQWNISDLDAHAWVEAWFPSYGWVRFDPTPTAAPARGGRSPIAPSTGSGSSTPAPHPSSHGHGPVAAAHAAGKPTGHPSGAPPNSPAPAIALVVLAVLAGLLAYLTRPLPGGEPELAELERAFARAGRPLGSDTTLLSLEGRLSASPPAAAYVRALRRARFCGDVESPSRPERRALRAQLRIGLGPLGRIRGLWALPPRRARRGHA